MKVLSGRKKRCAMCPVQFVPARTMQKVCGTPCAIALAQKQTEQKRRKQRAEQVRAEKHARAEHRRQKQAIKRLSEFEQEAQDVINLYVRLRDRNKPCCSCNKPATWGGQWHASHYRSVGAAGHLRFNLLNIHKSCSQCNKEYSGNIHGYRPRLIERIGVDRVEWLENYNVIVKWDREYLQRLKAVFAKRVRRLKKRIANGEA